jgi:hypothetical protein
MHARVLVVLLLAALVAVGCSAAQLKSQKDGAWSIFPRALPDTYEPLPSAYGHPFRAPAYVLHPVGVVLDWVLVRPFYLLASLAPEWFGLTTEDVQRYQESLPELVTPQNAPRRFE